MYLQKLLFLLWLQKTPQSLEFCISSETPPIYLYGVHFLSLLWCYDSHPQASEYNIIKKSLNKLITICAASDVWSKYLLPVNQPQQLSIHKEQLSSSFTFFKGEYDNSTTLEGQLSTVTLNLGEYNFSRVIKLSYSSLKSSQILNCVLYTSKYYMYYTHIPVCTLTVYLYIRLETFSFNLTYFNPDFNHQKWVLFNAWIL